MVGPGSNQANFQLVLVIPPGKLVDHKDALACVQEVDGSLLVGLKSFFGHWNVDGAPMDGVPGFVVQDNSFVFGRATGASSTGATESSCFRNCGWLDSWVWRRQVLRPQSVFVALGDGGIVDNVLVRNAHVEKILAALRGRRGKVSRE